MQSSTCWQNELKWIYFLNFHIWVGGGGGGGAGGSQSTASRSPFSRLPYFFVPLSPDFRPLLCFSRYHVNPAVWLPILIGSALALSKIKNCVVNRTTSHSPRDHWSGIPSTQVNTTQQNPQRFVNYSPTERAPRTDFPHHIEKYRDRSIKMVFDDILSDSLCCSYGEFRQLARQTRHWHDWHSRHSCTCVMPSHSCPMI